MNALKTIWLAWKVVQMTRRFGWTVTPNHDCGCGRKVCIEFETADKSPMPDEAWPKVESVLDTMGLLPEVGDDLRVAKEQCVPLGQRGKRSADGLTVHPPLPNRLGTCRMLIVLPPNPTAPLVQ
jgi:hypothetical protein